MNFSQSRHRSRNRCFRHSGHVSFKTNVLRHTAVEPPNGRIAPGALTLSLPYEGWRPARWTALWTTGRSLHFTQHAGAAVGGKKEGARPGAVHTEGHRCRHGTPATNYSRCRDRQPWDMLPHVLRHVEELRNAYVPTLPKWATAMARSNPGDSASITLTTRLVDRLFNTARKYGFRR